MKTTLFPLRVSGVWSCPFVGLALLAVLLFSCSQKYADELPQLQDAPSEQPAAQQQKAGTSPSATTKTPGARQSARRSDEAQQLYDYLCSIYGSKILSGTMATVNWNINEAQWVFKHTGRWPAINCFDFIHHVYSSPGGWIDYSNTKVVEDWHNQGGIVAAMWHWNVPTGNGTDYSFYSENNKFDVRKIFDEQSAEYALMIKDIDQISGYLLQLKKKGIPVLWRPLHEAGGKWFWWGMDASACCQLWRVMYERFEAAGLDNLIWVWTHAAGWKQPFSVGMDWYPGDEYVDIVGFDLYNVSSAADCNQTYFQWLSAQCPDKLVALTECGNVASISSQWNAGARWLFFMPWYDYGRTNNPQSGDFNSADHGNASISWWNDAWNTEDVLSRDQVELIPLSVKVPTL